MQDLRIAAIQADLVWEDRAANLAHFDHLIEEVKGQQDLIILPEMFNTAFSMKPKEYAEPADGETYHWLQRKAIEYGAAFVGSWMVVEEGRYYNRLYFAKPDGTFCTYDKRHLFRMGDENKHFSAGKDQLVVDYKGWKIKPLICYDLRFPSWAKNTFNKGQYDVDLLIYIANWPAARSKPWRTLLEARAIENQTCVVGVNRIGHDEMGNDYSGDTLIFNAKGETLASLENWKEGIAYAVLSQEGLDSFRKKFTVGLDWDIIEIKD